MTILHHMVLAVVAMGIVMGSLYFISPEVWIFQTAKYRPDLVIAAAYAIGVGSGVWLVSWMEKK